MCGASSYEEAVKAQLSWWRQLFGVIFFGAYSVARLGVGVVYDQVGCQFTEVITE